MFRKIIVIGMLAGIFSCTATLQEDKFITQSEVLERYNEELINNWQQQFPGHKLNTLSLTTTNNEAQLEGLYLDNPDSDSLIFVIQGNGMQVKEGGIAMLKTLSPLGLDIVIFDRRGLGASSGKATIMNLASDANEQYQYIKSVLKPNKVIVHGYSLGSFIATQLAKEHPIDALVLQGSATNVDDWIAAKTPWYMYPFLTVNMDPAFHLANNQVIVEQQYQNPLLIIAGEDDQQVPVSLSQKLFNASQSANKKLIIVEGADHGNMFKAPATTDIYIEFLTSI
ncbi:alpha/beta fold hydrolase [Colwellia sp. KU-HH00111]|uniref:alpha/beta hydrolase n=1 Tax=Colwellia sp. KU-HH00111 TaxID=3127652 RepID=UPI003103B329